MTDELWKNIENYESYSVSDLGNVRNDTTSRILKPSKDTNGYLLVDLCKNGIQKSFNVHRLVALAFIENPENKECVDHIDNNPQNNNLTNLRWATITENARNRKMDIRNTSGFKGVYFNKATNKWRTQINIGGKRISLGTFEKIEDAIIARQIKANEIFGEFINDCEKV